MKQREMMRLLWASGGGSPDTESVVREYAARELAGEVERGSNRSDLSPADYARRLLADGLAKGWLTGAPRDSGRVRPGPQITKPYGAGDPPAPTAQSREEWADEAAHYVGAVAETHEYLSRVSAWRAAWRPPRVRVLLIAESHVAEVPGDLEAQVRPLSEIRTSIALPTGFCRLVYCLGYGEGSLCWPKAPSGNRGTPQYWNLLGAIASAHKPDLPPSMPRGGATGDADLRLQWKVNVLGTLRQSGVWLEDASIIALYIPGGGRRAKGRKYLQLVRASFERFVWPGVAPDQPEHVWVIGRGVGNALEGLPAIHPERVICQPQVRDPRRFNADLDRLLRAIAPR